MCVMSMVMDHYGDEWNRRLNPWFPSLPPVPQTFPITVLPPTQAELDEFRRLLDRAREYDKKHNEPDCELEEKKEKIRKLAEELGVRVDFIEEKQDVL